MLINKKIWLKNSLSLFSLKQCIFKIIFNIFFILKYADVAVEIKRILLKVIAIVIMLIKTKIIIRSPIIFF